MSKSDQKFILGVLTLLTQLIWGIIKYTVLLVWYGTKGIWDKGSELTEQKKRKQGIAIRTLSIMPVLIVFWVGIFLDLHQEELKQGGIKAAWCIITKGKCITREIRQDLREDMRDSLSGSLIYNTGLTQ